MATQDIFLTFPVKPIPVVLGIKQGESREYRNDENLINPRIVPLMRYLADTWSP